MYTTKTSVKLSQNNTQWPIAFLIAGYQRYSRGMPRETLTKTAISYLQLNKKKRSYIEIRIRHIDHHLIMTITTAATKPLIKTSVLLSRLPLVTREPSAFEKQYKQYQYDLEKRLMWTFPTYFYFKKGTVAEHKFESVQNRPIRKKPGVYYVRGEPNVKHNREISMRQDIVIPRDAETENDVSNSDSLNRRIIKRSVLTKADELNDTLSLERKLRNHLYLLVNDATEKGINKSSSWSLPQFTMDPELKSLYDNVSHGMERIGGKNMKTWIVSKKPIAVIEQKKSSEEPKSNFVLKSHIIAGKFIPTAETLKYQWLTKQEISEVIDPVTYKKIQYFLDD